MNMLTQGGLFSINVVFVLRSVKTEPLSSYEDGKILQLFVHLTLMFSFSNELFKVCLTNTLAIMTFSCLTTSQKLLVYCQGADKHKNVFLHKMYFLGHIMRPL